MLDSVKAMDTIRILTGTRIDGAPGVDFMRRYGIPADFASLSLTDDKN